MVLTTTYFAPASLKAFAALGSALSTLPLPDRSCSSTTSFRSLRATRSNLRVP